MQRIFSKFFKPAPIVGFSPDPKRSICSSVLLKEIIRQRRVYLLEGGYPLKFVQLTEKQFGAIESYMGIPWTLPVLNKVLGLWPVTHLTFRLPGAVYLGHE